MKTVFKSIVILVTLSCGLLAKDQETRSSIKNLDQKVYLKMLPHVKRLHSKGSKVYSNGELADLKCDWQGLKPIMVVVQHNNVDVVILSKDFKVVRYNFSRVVGAWAPKKAIWVVNFLADTGERQQVYLEGYIVSDEEYSKDQLYTKYLQNKMHQASR